jgi:hypothetical protein
MQSVFDLRARLTVVKEKTEDEKRRNEAHGRIQGKYLWIKDAR